MQFRFRQTGPGTAGTRRLQQAADPAAPQPQAVFRHRRHGEPRESMSPLYSGVHRRHEKRQRIDTALVLWSKSDVCWRSGLSQQRKMPNDFLKSFGIFLSYTGFVPDSFSFLRYIAVPEDVRVFFCLFVFCPGLFIFQFSSASQNLCQPFLPRQTGGEHCISCPAGSGSGLFHG
ncbi:hypothetical protein SAMN04488054_11954 [Salibacterium qingdaonense]|uniref:Uncharacterized protein n=1 Tax=Salibacterium qingdaonense TaxID=266892 RepID=A0A1I4NQI3_9BACI|nr:hypothetical protein SAMN04488054_11954 [Salibacterium qingdaonense]